MCSAAGVGGIWTGAFHEDGEHARSYRSVMPVSRHYDIADPAGMHSTLLHTLDDVLMHCITQVRFGCGRCQQASRRVCRPDNQHRRCDHDPNTVNAGNEERLVLNQRSMILSVIEQDYRF